MIDDPSPRHARAELASVGRSGAWHDTRSGARPGGPTAAVLGGAAGGLLAHVQAELPALAMLDARDRLLAAAWLASLRSARTRRAYAGDLLSWRRG